MEKVLIGCILAVCSATSSAAPEMVQMPVVCDDTKTMFTRLQNEFREQVIIYADGENRDDGKDSNIITSIWVNKEESTLSVVKTYVTQKVSCLVASGIRNKYKQDSIGL